MNKKIADADKILRNNYYNGVQVLDRKWEVDKFLIPYDDIIKSMEEYADCRIAAMSSDRKIGDYIKWLVDQIEECKKGAQSLRDSNNHDETPALCSDAMAYAYRNALTHYKTFAAKKSPLKDVIDLLKKVRDKIKTEYNNVVIDALLNEALDAIPKVKLSENKIGLYSEQEDCFIPIDDSDLHLGIENGKITFIGYETERHYESGGDIHHEEYFQDLSNKGYQFKAADDTTQKPN